MDDLDDMKADTARELCANDVTLSNRTPTGGHESATPRLGAQPPRAMVRCVLGVPGPCDLSPYTNESAFSVRDTFSLHRAYMLFRTMSLRHLIVTDADNRVVGVLTRRDLMKSRRLHDVLHPHGHDDDHGHGHEHGGGQAWLSTEVRAVADAL
jgi:hypothetical protein